MRPELELARSRTTGALTVVATLEAGVSFAPEEALAASGTLGPGRTPAKRGHTTPIKNPAAAMAPTPVQEGRSEPGEGTCTASGPSAFRKDIGRTITIWLAAKRKPGGVSSPDAVRSRYCGRTTSSRKRVPPS